MNRFLFLIIYIFVPLLANAQCAPLGWLSCSTAKNPHPDTEEKDHWILYDFGEEYYLTTSTFWNYNHPDATSYGMKRIRIDYSENGRDWLTWGEYDLDQATGTEDYDGQPGPNFDTLKTRFLLITGLSNFGGECYGLWKVKFNLSDVPKDSVVLDDPVDTTEVDTTVVTSVTDPKGLDLGLALSPNPVKNALQVNIQSNSSEELWIQIINSMGQPVYNTRRKAMSSGSTAVGFDASQLSPGIYFVRVLQKGKVAVESFLRAP